MPGLLRLLFSLLISPEIRKKVVPDLQKTSLGIYVKRTGFATYTPGVMRIWHDIRHGVSALFAQGN